MKITLDFMTLKYINANNLQVLIVLTLVLFLVSMKVEKKNPV